MVAGVYAYFALRTLWAVEQQSSHAGDQVEKMQRQLEVMQEQIKSAYINDRAYVGVDAVNVVGMHKDGDLRFVVWFKNGGRTPAWGYKARAWVNVGTKPHAFEWSDDPEATIEFMPSEARRKLVFGKGIFTNDDIEAIKSGRSLFFVPGEFRYSIIGQKQVILCFGITYNNKGVSERYQNEREDKPV